MTVSPGPPRTTAPAPSPSRDTVGVTPSQLTAGQFWAWAWTAIRPVQGYVVTGLGFLALFIAYLGVSREVLVARQLPYLVSGGLLGVGLVTLGSRLLLIQDLRRDSHRLDSLEAGIEELRAVLLSRPDAPDPDPDQTAYRNGSRSETSARSGGRVFVLSGGATFHRPDCAVVQGKDGVGAVSSATAQRRGLNACPLCQPLAAGV